MVLNSHYGHLLSDGRGVLNFLWTGVYLFFVISGFVFARNILYKEVELFPFIIRRFFRIYPLYFFSLVIYYFLTPNDPKKISYFIKHLFFLNTMTYSMSEIYFFNPAYWSLPVEIVFYIFVPLFSCIRRSSGLALLLSLFPFFLLLKFMFPMTSAAPKDIVALAGTHLGLMSEFFIGIFLYLAYNKISAKETGGTAYVLLPFLSGAGILSLLCRFFVLYGDEGINGNAVLKAFYPTFCAIGYASVLLSFLVFFKNKEVKAFKTFIFFGSISYGTYLLHNIFPRLTDRIGVRIDNLYAYFAFSGAVLLLAFLCYRYLENPLHKLGKRLALRLARTD